MSDTESGGPTKDAGALVRATPPEVTRLNRNALILVMGMAAVTVFVAVASLNSSRTTVGQSDSAASRVPIVLQRPVLPPLRLVTPGESGSTRSVPSAAPVPPPIAFEQREVRAADDEEHPWGRSVAARAGGVNDGDRAYRRALMRGPLIADRKESLKDTSSAGGSSSTDADVERALLAPLLKNSGASGLEPNNGQLPLMPPGNLGDASAVSQRAAREHRDFLLESRAAMPASAVSSVDVAPSQYELTAGTAIGADLMNDVNSDLPGTVVAQVERDVYDSRTETAVLVPRASRLIGRYDERIVPGQSRVLVAWTRLIFPDGSSVDLPGVAATDGNGATGVPGNVNSHLSRVFEDAAVLSVLGAGAQLSQPRSGSTVFSAPSVGQTIGAAAGEQLASVGTEMVRQGLTVKPTIVAAAGAPVAVLLADDLVFPGPYRDGRSVSP